ncbi:AAA family ATPase [uncultured Mitsuokella sp.]|uniref:AAA family ATPase n=1 Tax=uncultured Mitsuokella sp. TaxID=453120 RepID=UPI00260424EB|nr:AAA family ATPase [uncultured Mitsuokella sp.]
MKAELVEKVIVAHCSGDEQQFSEALNNLVKDEEKKGNMPTANRFRKAYEEKKSSSSTPADFSVGGSGAFFSQSSSVAAPRDKDSLLELYDVVTSDVSFDEVVLPENQKKIIQQFIDEQKNAERLNKHNIPAANRLLLCGPPGCGKTMTAYAIGNALKLPIAYVRLDGLVSSYLGQTSINLRKVFDSVKNKRIILLLDEFDAIAKKRDDANELGELKRVMTTLLQNFDNLPDNVVLIAATNHEHLLDPAIWRRFNLTITLDLPGLEQRKVLIQNGLKKYGITAKINTSSIAKITDGMSGALIDELMLASAKKFLLDGKLQTTDITTILIQQKTKYSDNNEDAIKVIIEMLDRGVSLRAAANALGISHSTLEYQVNKYRGGNNG